MARNGALGVFLAALALRVLYLVAVHSGDASLQHVDSDMWLDFGADTSKWLGNHERMPFYPLYLGLFNATFGRSPLPPVLGQILIDAGTCVLIARLAGRAHPRLALPAGMVAAANPTQIVMCCVLLGDTLFTFFVAGALAAALRWMRETDARAAAMFAIWGGMALLNRAVIWPMLVLVPAAMVAFGLFRAIPARKAVASAALFAALSMAFTAPVVLRNVATHGVISLSSQSGHHAANWIVPLVRQTKDGTPFAESQAEAGRRVRAEDPEFDIRDPFVQADAWSRYARVELATLGPVAMLNAWMAGAAINFFSPAILMSPPLMALPRTGYYATPGTGNIEKMSNFLFRNDNGFYVLWLGIGAAIDVPLKLLALAGISIGLWRSDTRLASLALSGWIVFVLAVSGPVASAKYRLPIEPACIAFVALALVRPVRAEGRG